jgi:hypothetical protein
MEISNFNFLMICYVVLFQFIYNRERLFVYVWGVTKNNMEFINIIFIQNVKKYLFFSCFFIWQVLTETKKNAIMTIHKGEGNIYGYKYF